MDILRTIDAEKEIYLADHKGNEVIVTPAGAPIDCDEIMPTAMVRSWVVLDGNWEEIDLIDL